MNDARPSIHDADQTEFLADRERDTFELLAEEFAERCRKGDSHSIDEYALRYPEYAEKIRKLLPTVALMEQLKRGVLRERANDPDARLNAERLGEFRVLRELGHGGMGVVYEAVQESLGRHVALKVVHNVHLNPKRLQRFQREAQAVAQLHHTNIVPIFGVGDHEGLPYYVMQYIKGNGLDQLVETWRHDESHKEESRWRFVARVGEQAAEALEYAHSQGVLHRDIKPANLLLDEHGTIWITDFGLAKLTGLDDLTASGDVVGTLRYLAPEALKGETGARSDVYSLGLTLYELLTLNAPFGDLSPSELLRHVNEEQPVRPRKLAPALPRDLETIVLKAIAREPAHRYPNAGALAADLNRFLEDRPILARRATVFERLWRWGRRNRLAAAMTITAASALLIAMVIGWAGYAITSKALQRSNENVALSLEVFGELFDQLASHDPISTPPLGETGGLLPPDRGRGEFRRPPGAAFGPPPMNGRPGLPFQRMQEDDTSLLESILTFYDRFARQNATDPNPRLEAEAAWAYRKVGALYARLGRDADSQEAYARAITMFEALVERYPNVPEYREKLVKTFDMADPQSAPAASLETFETWLRKARGMIDQLAREKPDDLAYAFLRARIHVKLGATFERLNQWDKADACFREAIEFEGKMLELRPTIDGLRMDRASTREALALLDLKRKRPDDARALLEAAVDDLNVVMTADRPTPPFQFRLRSLAEAFKKLGDTARAQELARLADQADMRHPLPPHGGPGRSRRPERRN